MKKILITSFIVSGAINICIAQFQIGQGINPWFHRVPQTLNMSLVSLDAVPTVSFTVSGRMDGFRNYSRQGCLLASGYITNDIGIGFKINNEQAGLSSATDAQLSFISHVLTSQNGDKLSFYIGGHFIQNKFAADDVIVINSDDPSLKNVSESQPSANASAGLSILRENKHFIGLSVSQLFENRNSFLNNVWDNKSRRTYYFIGTYCFDIDESYAIELSGACVYAGKEQFIYETGIDLKLKQTLWFGTGYRSTGAIKFNAGVTAQSWSFGYLCFYGSSFDAKEYTYKFINNSIFIRKVFNEGRPNL